MALANSAPPDFQDEFERKLLETSVIVQGKFESGQISAHTYQEILEAINGMSRGLCSEQFCLWMDVERENTGYKNDTDSVFMMAKNGSEPVVVSRRIASGEITVTSCKSKPVINKIGFEDAIFPSKEAAKRVKQIEVALIKKGYRRVM